MGPTGWHKERGLKKEKREEKKKIPCCWEPLDESIPDTEGFTKRCTRITPHLSPAQPGEIRSPSPARHRLQPMSSREQSQELVATFSSCWAAVIPAGAG